MSCESDLLSHYDRCMKPCYMRMCDASFLSICVCPFLFFLGTNVKQPKCKRWADCWCDLDVFRFPPIAVYLLWFSLRHPQSHFTCTDNIYICLVLLLPVGYHEAIIIIHYRFSDWIECWISRILHLHVYKPIAFLYSFFSLKIFKKKVEQNL